MSHGKFALSLWLIWLWQLTVANSPALAFQEVTLNQQLYDSFLAAQRQDAAIHDLYALSSDHVWAVGDRGLILKSDDGGRSWKSQESGVTCPLRGIYFVDSQRGWAVGYQVQPFSHRSCGVILATSDGGKKWQLLSQPFLPALFGITKTESGNLLSWGSWSTHLSSSVFESMDGGLTWAPAPNVSQEYRKLIPLQSGWFGIDRTDSLWHWELHAQQRLVIPDGDRIVDIAKANDAMVAIGQSGEGYRLATGTLQPTAAKIKLEESAIGLSAVAGFSDRMWLANSAGDAVYRTLDNGDTWQKIATGFSLPIRKLVFLDGNRGWAIGELGNILATRDGGESWWIQRPGGSRVGALFLAEEATYIPWGAIAYCATELKRITTLVVFEEDSRATYNRSVWRQRVEAAAAAVGVSQVVFQQKPSIQTDSSGVANPTPIHHGEVERYYQGLLNIYRPELVFVCNGGDKSKNSVKENILRASRTTESSRQEIRREPFRDRHDRLHKIYAISDVKIKSFELGGQQVLKQAGMLLSDVTHRATTLVDERLDLYNDTHLLLLYTDNPKEGVGNGLMDGFIASTEASREVDLSHQGSLQIVLGSAARRRSLDRLVASDQEIRDAIWNDAYRDVMATLTKDEIDFADIWLAERLHEQGRWQRWQVVAEAVIRRQPDCGAAELMWKQLLTVAGSAEVNHWRSESVHDNQLQTGSSMVVTAAAEDSDNPPASPFDTGANRRTGGTVPTETTSVLDSSALDKGQERVAQPNSQSSGLPTAALMAWIVQQLPMRHPVLVGEPDVLLSLASWYSRFPDNSPMAIEVQNGLSRLSQQTYLGNLQQAAQYELDQLQKRSSNKPANALVASLPDVGAKAGLRGLEGVTAGVAKERPLLDGKAEDSCWKETERLSLIPANAEAGVIATQIQFAYDAEWLFVLIECQGSETQSAAKPGEKRGYDSNLLGHDRFCLAFDLDRDRSSAFEFEVDQRGLTRDKCWQGISWNPRWFVAQHHGDRVWTSEIAIPVKAISDRPLSPGMQIGLQFHRIDPRGNTRSWPLATDRGGQTLESGILVFK